MYCSLITFDITDAHKIINILYIVQCTYIVYTLFDYNID